MPFTTTVLLVVFGFFLKEITALNEKLLNYTNNYSKFFSFSKIYCIIQRNTSNP